MASEIKFSEYWKEVEDTANEIADETKEQDEDREWAFDRLWETIDGHQWVIYTWAYPWVLMHTDAEDTLFDEMGSQQAVSYSQIMQQMTFMAFHQNVGEKLEEVLQKRGIE